MMHNERCSVEKDVLLHHHILEKFSSSEDNSQYERKFQGEQPAAEDSRIVALEIV